MPTARAGRSTQRPEGVAQLLREDLRLLPGGEVPALLDPVVVNELRIRLLRPALRSRIELVREDGDTNRDLDARDVEEGQMALPVEAGRGHCRIRQPVVGDVVEDVVAREASRISGESACDELVAALVVIKHPGRQADRRVRDGGKRLAWNSRWRAPSRHRAARSLACLCECPAVLRASGAPTAR